MRGDDYMLGLLLVGGIVMMRRRAPGTIPLDQWGDGWMWPVPNLQTADGVLYKAVISDGVGTDRPNGAIHRGVDIMYLRRNRGDRPEYKPRTTDGTDMFFAPPLVPVVAARDGAVWFAERTPRGWSVVVDHGKPFATYYTHLAALAIAPHRDGRSLATGRPTRVRAGQVLGVMGYDPMDGAKLRHLHFSVAHNGPPEGAAIDPQPAMRAWSRMAVPFRV